MSRAENLALVFTGPEKVELQERPMPAPGPGQALVRTRCSLISAGTELTVLSGRYAPGSVWSRLAAFPYFPGYSNVGVVVAVGPDVDSSWVGRRVHSHGPHQAFALTPSAKMAAVPDGVSDEDATFTTLAKVAMNGLRRGGLTWGESAAVVGLGIVGQLAVRLCLFAGARPTFAIEPAPERRAKLPTHPGLRVLPAKPFESLRDDVRAGNRGRLLDMVFEATGDPDVIPGEATLLRPQGRLVITSSPRGPSSFDFHDLCNRESLHIIGAHSLHHPLEETPDTPWTSRRHGELFLEMLASGAFSVSSLVSHRFRGCDAVQAYEHLRHARASTTAVVLDWTGSEDVNH